MKIHPYCELFPPMSEDEFDALVTDITMNGQVEPILTYKNQIIDGKHRFRACEAAFVDPKFAEWKPKTKDVDREMLTFVVSKNLHRRQLSVSQRGMMSAEIATIKHGGSRLATDQGANLHLDISIEQASELMGVSPRTIKTSKEVAAKASKPLADAVRAGEVTVADAVKIVDLPKSEQNKAVKAVARGEAKTVAAAAKKKGPCQINGQHEWESDGNGTRYCTHCKEDYTSDGPGAWKELRRKLDKTYAAAMRAVDDLHESKKNKPLHAKHIDTIKELRKELESW